MAPLRLAYYRFCLQTSPVYRNSAKLSIQMDAGYGAFTIRGIVRVPIGGLRCHLANGRRCKIWDTPHFAFHASQQGKDRYIEYLEEFYPLLDSTARANYFDRLRETLVISGALPHVVGRVAKPFSRDIDILDGLHRLSILASLEERFAVVGLTDQAVPDIA